MVEELSVSYKFVLRGWGGGGGGGGLVSRCLCSVHRDHAVSTGGGPRYNYVI